MSFLEDIKKENLRRELKKLEQQHDRAAEQWNHYSLDDSAHGEKKESYYFDRMIELDKKIQELRRQL